MILPDLVVQVGFPGVPPPGGLMSLWSTSLDGHCGVPHTCVRYCSNLLILIPQVLLCNYGQLTKAHTP